MVSRDPMGGFHPTRRGGCAVAPRIGGRRQRRSARRARIEKLVGATLARCARDQDLRSRMCRRSRCRPRTASSNGVWDGTDRFGRFERYTSTRRKRSLSALGSAVVSPELHYEVWLSTVTARRFCDQQEISLHTATGLSLPYEIVCMRSPDTPLETR